MINYITNPFKWFFKLEAASGLLLLVAAAAALIVSNSYLSESYHYEFTGFIWLDIEWVLFSGCLLIGMISALYPAIKAYQTGLVL